MNTNTIFLTDTANNFLSTICHWDFFLLDFNERIYTFNQPKIDTEANSHHRNGITGIATNV